MTYDELKQIAERVGKLDGWDFSHIRAGRDPVLWDYVEVVRQYLKPTDRVLDIGTGGGEIFLSLADSFAEGVAVDQNPKMIETAQRNLSEQSIGNVTLIQMEASDLHFHDASFDIVLTRHLRVYPEQIIRVLRSGGYFITQMVGQRISLNLLEGFGWTPASFGPDWWQTADELAQQFQDLGCHVLAKAEYDVPYWFEDLESLIFYILSVPWPEKIVLEQHWQSINRIVETCQSERGFESNEHQELLIVQKRGANDK
ncbi:MAG: class I SAM-dependent methyltransferase [Chloroflexota bacterium]